MKIVFTRSSTIYDDSRATKEITVLLDAGNTVNVLGWDRDGLALEKCKELFYTYGSHISFSFFSGDTGKTMIGKIIKRREWALWLKHQLSRIADIDVIHACDFDTGVTVREFSRGKNIKYIYDIYDYYVDAHPVPRFLKKLVENNEIKIINEANLTIICTEERKEQIKKAAPKKLVVIYNSPEVHVIEENAEEYDYAYCGSLYDGRLIMEILDEYPNHYKHLRFVFAGYGEYTERAQELASKYRNFTFLNSIPYAQVLEIERKSKVISAVYDPQIRNHQFCAPNKFYEALALGKPLIVCKGTGIDKIVEKERLGLVINYNVHEFYDALDRLINNESDRENMGLRARKIYESEYKWELMKDRLSNGYKSL